MAMLLSLALFVVWTTVGLAALNAGRFRGGVRKLLLAPAVGLAALSVGTYIAVRSGVPVGQSASPIGGAALVFALVVLWGTRTTLARAGAVLRRYGAFAAVLGAAFLLNGWPLFRFGYDWVANGNDDMANYCIGAAGFKAHGYLRVPTPEELNSGQDYTQPMWFLYHDSATLTQKRCGAELTLALASTWTGLTPQQVFMPVLLALNAALVSATAGLVLGSTRRRSAALWAAGLLTVSSQTGYGVVQQLIAQAAGLGLLCASLAMVTSPFRRFPPGALVRRAAVCGLVFAGLIVFYPEAVPFLVGACLLLGARDLFRRHPVRRHLGHAGAAITAMTALVPVYLYGTAFFLLGQASQGAGADAHTIEIFPYFMTPRGPALVLGLLPTYADAPEPRHTASLVLGLALLVAGVLVALGQFRRGRPFAAVLLVMGAMGCALYAQRAAFGLFKIAMFAQPFLWATVAAWAASRRRRLGAACAAALLLVVGSLNARTQYWYVKQSTGHDSRVDLPAVTQQKLMSTFHTAVGPRLASGEVSRVLVASENNVLVKLLGAELRDVPNAKLTMAPYHRYLPPDEAAIRTGPHRDTPATRAQEALRFGPTERADQCVFDPETRRPLHQLLSPSPDWTADAPDRVLVVAGCGQLSVLNRQRYPETEPALLCAPLSEVRNFAVFRDATAARQNYLGMDRIADVALHRLEPDPMFPKRTMAGVGRHLVLDVLNPTPRVRVVMDYSTSFRAQPERGVAPQVVGDRRVALGATGVGSARLVSPPLAPQRVGPAHVLAIDFGIDPIRHTNRLTGLEKLWGAEIARDRRLLAATARNISVLSEEEYAAFRPPQQVAQFPNDLAHPHLEYSGFYEEGWVGTAFKVRLTQPAPDQEAVVRGMIPQVPPEGSAFRTEATVLIDGAPVEKRALGTGAFELRAPAGATSGPRWIEVRFSHGLVLPAPDGRPAVAHIEFVGFEPKNEARSRPPEKIAAFPADLSHPKGDVSGLAADGWAEKQSSVLLWAPGPDRDAVVRGAVPDVAQDGTFRTELTVLIDGTEIAKRVLAPGEFEVRVPAGAKTAQARKLECRFSNTQVLPAPDGRAVGAHLRLVGFEPAKLVP